MNELQLSLLGLGVLAILLVLIYNRWLERKYQKQREIQQEPSVELEPSAAKSAAARQEPQWDHGESEGRANNDAIASVAVESAQAIASGLGDLSEPLPTLSDAEAWVDAIASLRFYEPRSAGSIRDTIEQMGDQRFERVDCYAGDAWHATDKLPADALVSNVRCRLQLATRRGAVLPDRLHEWMRSVEDLAETLSAGLSVESEATILERARNLDAFCARVDALINLNLRARDPAVMVPKFSRILSGHGLTGTYPALEKLNVFGDVDFRVMADEATGLVSVTLDFPHVTRPDLAVIEMLSLARSLAGELNAEIVDDEGRQLGEEGMTLLSNQVVRLGAMLQAQGIEPGSALSRRLFS